jgi:hypothetical protein
MNKEFPPFRNIFIEEQFVKDNLEFFNAADLYGNIMFLQGIQYGLTHGRALDGKNLTESQRNLIQEKLENTIKNLRKQLKVKLKEEGKGGILNV